MNLQVGLKFYNRAGAIVEIIERRNTGLTKFTLDWKPAGNALMIVCRTVNGNGNYCVFETGNYHPSTDHALDLVREIESVMV